LLSLCYARLGLEDDIKYTKSKTSDKTTTMSVSLVQY
jgi:hypothetical protein